LSARPRKGRVAANPLINIRSFTCNTINNFVISRDHLSDKHTIILEQEIFSWDLLEVRFVTQVGLRQDHCALQKAILSSGTT
jgi:hypothetical protein